MCASVGTQATKGSTAQWHVIYDCSPSEVKTLKIFSQTHKTQEAERTFLGLAKRRWKLDGSAPVA